MKWIQGLCILSIMVAFCNCGTSPQQLCKDVVVAFCKKTIECVSADVRDLDPNLKDQASCEAAYNTKNNCDKDDICLGAGTYKADKAGACVGEYNALTCGDVSGDYSAKIPSCAEVCK